jgi:hypothetical periplasmic protein
MLLKKEAAARYAVALLLIFCSKLAAAADEKQDDTALQVQQRQWLDTLAGNDAAPKQPEKNEQAGQPQIIGDDFLIAHPKILEDALQQAINDGNAELVSSLAALYRKLPEHDPYLLGRAEALLLALQEKSADAVERYRQLHRQDPADPRVLLDLAAAEFRDNRLGEAAEHFAQTQRYELPAPVAANVSRYRQAIARQTGWRWSGGISPVRNSNVNNAPPRYCIDRGVRLCSVSEPLAANGLNYELGVEKLTPLHEHHYLQFRANFSGTSYFFDRKSAYDDAFGRAYLGWQWRDGRQTFSLLPFYQAQLSGSSEFDGKPENNRRIAPYMLAHGIGLQASHSLRFSPASQLYTSFEHYRNHYREPDRAYRNNGSHSSFYLSLAHRFGAHTTLFGSYQYSRFAPAQKTIRNRQNNAAYHRHGIGIGWLQQWPALGGLRSRITASFAQRRYRGIAAFSTEAQRNRESSFALELSHDKLEYAGIRPTLNYEYSRTRSNMPYAERRRKQLFVGAEWSF